MEGAKLQLIVGLGNPGSSYRNTRHNIGFMVLDQFAKKRGFQFQRCGNAEIAREPSGRILMKPMSYMNLSGEPVSEFVRYYKILPEQVLVILDDVALPLGILRIRRSGSAGGHNGLASILSLLSTEVVPRLRLGISGPHSYPMADYVLGKFSQEEAPLLEQAVARACDAIESLSSTGIDSAMNQFN